jgi:excisionase family DNA binding protein
LVTHKEWYTPKEVAKMLDKSVNAIYAMQKAGKLRHYRSGSSRRTRIEDLQAYCDANGMILEELLASLDEEAGEKAGAEVEGEAEEIGEVDGEPVAAPALAALAVAKATTLETSTPEASAALPAGGGRRPHLRVAQAAPSRRGAASAREGMSSRAARQREAEYVARFRALFSSGVEVAHPELDDMICPADWARVEQEKHDRRLLSEYLKRGVLPKEVRDAYPNNVRVLYTIQPHSLGDSQHTFPRQGLIIECAVLSRLDRYVNAGYDEEKLGLATLLPELAKRQSSAQTSSPDAATPPAYLLGLASTTGWNEESIDYVGKFEDAHLMVYLVDLIDQRVCASSAHPKSAQYGELFELPPEE